jgi:hypothetical protein
LSSEVAINSHVDKLREDLKIMKKERDIAKTELTTFKQSQDRFIVDLDTLSGLKESDVNDFEVLLFKGIQALN